MTPHLVGAVAISYEGFPTPSPSTRSIQLTQVAVDRAAIMVGNLNAFTSSAPSTVGAIAQQWRTAITRDSIEISGGQWWRSDPYNQLERTEKGFMSGLLGGVISKLVAENVFGIQQFGHIEYFPSSAITYADGDRHRPDFLGLPTRPGESAIVVESKGRSGYFPGWPSQVAKAKAQVNSVVAVPGYPTLHRYVQYTHFNDGVLEVNLYDPPGPAADSDRDDTPSKIDLRAYYRDVVNAAVTLQAQRVDDVGGVDYRIFTHDLLNLAVGVPEPIYQAVREDQPLPIGAEEVAPINTADVAAASRVWWQEGDYERSSDITEVMADVGPDGIAVVGSYPRHG